MAWGTQRRSTFDRTGHHTGREAQKAGTQPECFDVFEGDAAVILLKHSPNLQFADAPRLEIKADSTGRISGYGSVFGNVDSYGERVLPGAFKKSLEEHKRRGSRIKMLWQHRPDVPIGTWHQAAEDSKGLILEGTINLKTDAGRNAYEHIAAGDVDSLSIGYLEKEVQQNRDGVRDLIELDLYEVSPVTFPANRSAMISGAKSQAEIEQILRAGGLSKQAAKLVIAGGWKALSKSSQVDIEAASRFAALIDDATRKLKEI
ncbi:HK97 family phage prohead protease [Sinorhizobium meliloti]|nr:HK97 family phage prohead protease [Sinorhizobium meliloti]